MEPTKIVLRFADFSARVLTSLLGTRSALYPTYCTLTRLTIIKTAHSRTASCLGLNGISSSIALGRTIAKTSLGSTKPQENVLAPGGRCPN
jgi:hypothetical protein